MRVLKGVPVPFTIEIPSSSLFGSLLNARTVEATHSSGEEPSSAGSPKKSWNSSPPL